jgi:hypothetical protein
MHTADCIAVIYILKQCSRQKLTRNNACICVLSNVYCNARLQELSKRRLQALGQLMSLQWVPVHTVLPSPLLPPYKQQQQQQQGALHVDQLPRVAAPGSVRLYEDRWFSSASCRVLDAEVHSADIKAAFGWNVPVRTAALCCSAVVCTYEF